MSKKHRSVSEIKCELGEATTVCIVAEARRIKLRNEFAAATAIAHASVVHYLGWDGEGLPPHEVVPLSRLTSSYGTGITFGLTDEVTAWVQIGNDQAVPMNVDECEKLSFASVRIGVFRTHDEAEYWARKTAISLAAECRVKSVKESDVTLRVLH